MGEAYLPVLVASSASWLVGLALFYWVWTRRLSPARRWKNLAPSFASWVRAAVESRQDHAPDVEDLESAVEVLLFDVAPPRPLRVADRAASLSAAAASESGQR